MLDGITVSAVCGNSLKEVLIMIRLIVHDGVTEREVIGRRNGQSYKFFEQSATAYLGTGPAAEVRTIRLSRNKREDCVKPGTYTLDVEKSLRVDNYGNLSLGNRLALTPVVAGK